MNSTLYTLLERAEWGVNTAILLLSRLHRTMPQRRERKTVLVVRTDGIGDFILFSAVLPAYRSLFPEAHLILVVASDVVELARECPYVDEVWSIDVRTFRYNIVYKIRWLLRIRKVHCDVAIFPVYSLAQRYLEPLIGWSGAKRRIGHACLELNKERQCNPIYTELVPSSSSVVHELVRNQEFVRHLGYKGDPLRRTHLWLTPDVLPVEQCPRDPYAVLAPGARVSIKAWSWERYADVITRLNATYDLHWVVVGTQSEIQTAASLCVRLEERGIPCHNLAGRTSLSQLVGLLQKSVLCMGNDSSVIHFAQALGIPSVVVAGGGHFGRFVPYPDSDKQHVVFTLLDCYSCHWRCIYSTPRCLEEVTVDMVFQATNAALQQIPGLTKHAAQKVHTQAVKTQS